MTNNNNNFDFFLKLSLSQFLLSKDISFSYGEGNIVFNLLTLDYKHLIENELKFTYIEDEYQGIKFNNYFLVNSSFIKKNDLLNICNFLNQYSNKFEISIEFQNKNNLIIIKRFKKLENGEYIDFNFWQNNLKENLIFSSNICNFIFNDYYNSKEFFGKSEYLCSSSFNSFVCNKIDEYYMNHCYDELITEFSKIEKKTENSYEDKIKNFSKNEIENEINKELLIFSKTKDDYKLKILVKYLSN